MTRKENDRRDEVLSKGISVYCIQTQANINARVSVHKCICWCYNSDRKLSVPGEYINEAPAKISGTILNFISLSCWKKKIICIDYFLKLPLKGQYYFHQLDTEVTFCFSILRCSLAKQVKRKKAFSRTNNRLMFWLSCHFVTIRLLSLTFASY